MFVVFFFFKQKTAYEMRISDWSSDVCSSDLLGAVTAATACLVKGAPAHEVAEIPEGARKTLSIEHPSGEMSCVLEVDAAGTVVSSALLRTARKLMDGVVYD